MTPGEALYLPASRTGFMLTYKSLIQTMMGDMLEDERDSSSVTLTLPIFQFLQALVGLHVTGKGKYSDIGEFIESEVIHGKMIQDQSPLPTFYYQPTQQKKEMPLYITSSVVTELSPLILFLKSKAHYRTLFLEEVEAHLHPRIQRKVALAIARLVNRGLPVWLTTHSDLIFQQVNNLMKLKNHKEQQSLLEKFGYTKEDVLSNEQVKAYQFSTSGVTTTVEALEATENGFSVPTFNRVIIDLNKETYELQIGDEDE